MRTYLYGKWFVVFGLAIMIVILRLPTLEVPFDMDSGAIAYHARLILDGEPLYSSHHPAHHLPAVYYTYVLAFLIFGDSAWSVKILLIPWTLVTAYLIYMIGIRLDNKNIGILAAVIYAILNSHILLKGDTAESELFANLPITAAILMGIDLVLNRAKSWKFTIIGVLCAAAFLYKSVFLSPIAVTVFMIFTQNYLTRQTGDAVKTILHRILWIGTGFLITVLLVIGWFARLGLLSRFLMVFTLGQSYVDQLASDVLLLSIIIFPIIILGINNVILLFLSMGGVIHIFREVRKKYQTDNVFSVVGLGIILWYLLSIVTAGITRRIWLHYSIIVVPPLAILAAWEVCQIHRRLKAQRKEMKKSFSILVVVVLLFAAFLVSGLTNYRLYYHYAQYKLGNESYDEFLNNGSFIGGSNSVKLLKIADYIHSRTNPDDFIYSWSDDAHIYYYADRRAPVDIIWPLYAEATGSYQRIFSPQTKYIIVGDSILIEKPEWLYEELEKSYTLETIIDEQSIYRRKEN